MDVYNQDFYPSNFESQQAYNQQGYNQQGYWTGQTQYGYSQSAQYSVPYQQTSQSSGGGYENMEVDPTPTTGSMGLMTAGQDSYSYSSGTGFEEEPPLLEELGIDFGLIKENTLSVLNPLKNADANTLRNTDLAGPLVFCLLFGGTLLLSGKVHFGYIYGVGLLGCISMYLLLNLMSTEGVPASIIISVLGYCLLPMVLLSAVSIVVSLQGVLGTVLAVASIVWCSYSSSKLFVSVLSMDSQQLLVAYPCALLYGVFVLLTVF